MWNMDSADKELPYEHGLHIDATSSTGADVFGADGEKVGTVAAVYPGYIVVEKGFFFPTDYYIPMSADRQRERRPGLPEPGQRRGPEQRLGRPADRIWRPPATTTLVAHGVASSRRTVATDEEIRVPVMEEELTATVREREAGAVRIEKDVVTEEQTLDVPVTEERVRVERRVVDRPVSAADATAFEETVIDVPLRAETVDVQKQARVAEEVVVSKEATQRTEQVPRHGPQGRGHRRRGCHGRRVIHRRS